MNSENINFDNQTGGSLSAQLDLPHGPMRATAIFAYCFACGAGVPAYTRIAESLTSRGIAVLRLNFDGHAHGQNETPHSHYTDIVQAADFLAREYQAPTMLIGHSFGGAAVLAAALELDGIKAIATIGAPDSPANVEHLLVSNEGSSASTAAFSINPDFAKDSGLVGLIDRLGRLRAATLILHSPIDTTIGINSAGGIFSALHHPKSFVSLDNADHLLTRDDDVEYAASLIATWSERYLDLAYEDHTPKTPEGVVRVSEVEASHLTQDVFIDGRYSLIADEPASLGGRNLGPTPYQFVSAGLGACTSMTLRLYARRKGIALAHVYTDVVHDKVYVPVGDGKQRIDQFTRRIHLTGDLSDAERARMLEIADLCPVHKTLEREAHIVTELVKPNTTPAE